MDTHSLSTNPAIRPVRGSGAVTEAQMNYMVAMRERPYNYTFEPPPGEPRTNAVYRSYNVLVHDLRPIAGDVSLDREGFALVQHQSAVRDFYNEDELRRVYYPEAERLVESATGASEIVIFDHTIRRRSDEIEDRSKPGPRHPVPRAHVDYTVKSGPQRVRDLLGDKADAYLRRRFAIVNVWRPIRGPLNDLPLALCDAGSIAPEDLVATDQIYPDRSGEIYFVQHNPDHRWYYAPAMETDEALLLKCYDSALDGTARFSPHCAFEDPGAPAEKLPRESIELRTLIFFPS